MLVRRLAWPCLLGALLGPAAAYGNPLTTRDAVYSGAQARRGEETYMADCVSCHPVNTYVGAGFALAGFASAAEPVPVVRGNPVGEWRYWGADAWSTRYSPLDQINASNFDKLRVAWQWNAGAFGTDEYYRATPLYANGRLFTVASTRRIAMAIDPSNGKTLWNWKL